MVSSPVQLGAVLALLSILILLLRRRERLTAEDGEGFRNTVFGTCLLALVALSFLAESYGALSHVPFLSESVFFNLTTAIAAIAGVTLVAAGVLAWLPIGRARRNPARIRATRLELIRKTAQVVEIESDLTGMLEKALAHMVNQIGLPGGMVFVARRQSPTMRLLAAKKAGDDFVTDPSGLSVRLAESSASESSDRTGLRIEGAQQNGRPDIILPVAVNSRPVAAFLLWTPASGLDNDDRMLLLLARDMIARAIQSQLEAGKTERRRMSDALIGRLRAIPPGSALGETMPTLGRIIGELIPWDVLSLTVGTGSGQATRFTIGANGTLLTEKSLSLESCGVSAAETPTDYDPRVLAPGEEGDKVGLTASLPAGEYGSALVVPVRDGSALAGRLLLASRRADVYCTSHVDAARELQPELERTVSREIDQVGRERLRRQIEAITNLAVSCAERWTGFNRLCEEASASLRRVTGAAAVRIALFEDNGTFIRSKSLSSAHPVECGVPADGYMIRSIMPLHREVQASGQPLLVGGTPEAPEMSTAEAQQVYQQNLTTALLQPICPMGETVGIISLVDRRGPHRFRFTEEARAFVSSVASLLAVGWQIHETPWGALDMRDRSDFEAAARKRERGGRLRSSLTGIIGSAELLRSRLSGADVDRYVEIIDRSARRMEECLKEEEPA